MSPGSSVAPIHLSAIGVSLVVTFEAAPAGTREAFAHAWSRALLDSPVPDHHTDHTDGAVTVPAPAAPDAATALHHLSSSVTLAAIDAAAGQLWMLHAAGLADPTTGATVALVAPSGTGKSTAARTLGRSLAYLTDETVGVSADGRVLPHAKPLSIVAPGTSVKHQVSPDDAGLQETHAQPLLRAVVILERDGSATPWLEPIRTAAALPLLAEQTSHLTHLPRPLSFIAAILARTTGVQRLHYREIEDARGLVEGLLR